MKQRIFKYSLLFLFFLGLGLLFSHPLWKHLSTAIPYGGKGSLSAAVVPGDHLQVYYNLWHIAHNLFSGKLTQAHEFAMAGSSYNLFFFYFPVSYLLAPLIFLVGPVLTYNFFLLASFGLCGVIVFALTRGYTRNGWAALTAALLFALCPYRLSQLYGGHVNGFLCFYIPLAIFAFERGWKIIFLLTLLAIYSADLQMLYFFLLVFTPYFFIRLWNQSSSPAVFLRRLLPIAAIYLAVFALFLYAKTGLLSLTLETGGRKLNEIASYSWQCLFKKAPGAVEGNLYLGWIPFLLIGLGFAASLLGRRPKEPHLFKSAYFTRIAYFSVAAALTTFLSLGMSLDSAIPLYRWFYEHVPFFSFSRTPSRLILFSHLFLALLSGFAVSALFHFFQARFSAAAAKRAAVFGTILVSGFIIADLRIFNHVALCRMTPPPTSYQYLAQNIAAGDKLVFLPLFPPSDHFVSHYEYVLTVTQGKMLQGYSVIPPQCEKIIREKIQPLHEGELPADLVAFLKEQGVKYVVFHPRLYLRRSGFPEPAAVRNKLIASPHLVLEKAETEAWIFKFFADFPAVKIAGIRPEAKHGTQALALQNRTERVLVRKSRRGK